MTDPDELVDYYLSRLTEPQGWDAAFYSLAEADDEVLPVLERIFDRRPDDAVRELIVEGSGSAACGRQSHSSSVR